MNAHDPSWLQAFICASPLAFWGLFFITKISYDELAASPIAYDMNHYLGGVQWLLWFALTSTLILIAYIAANVLPMRSLKIGRMNMGDS